MPTGNGDAPDSRARTTPSSANRATAPSPPATATTTNSQSPVIEHPPAVRRRDATQIPSVDATNPTTTVPTAYPTATDAYPSRSSPSVSTASALYVVNAPRNPVPSSSRSRVPTSGPRRTSDSSSTPSRNAPTTLTRNVAAGQTPHGPTAWSTA